MIASIPHFVSRLSVVAKNLPARVTSFATTEGRRPSDGTTAPLTQSPAPLRTGLEQARNPLGDLHTKPGPNSDSLLPGPTEAFSRAWAKALEQAESTTAQRLRSTKGLSMPLAEAKGSPQIRTNDNVTTGVFANERTNPLPLVLALSTAQTPSAELRNALGVSGAAGAAGSAGSLVSSSISVTERDKHEIPQIAPGELAFTAKIKSPTSREGDEASAATTTSATLLPPTSKDSTSLGTEAVQLAKSTLEGAPLSTNAQSAPVEILTGSMKTSPAPHSDPVQAIEEAPAAAPQPMKEIALQLPGARGVEIRLSERAGEVRIDVRSGDAALTQDLRGNLHELVSGLERKGFAAEVSHLPDHAFPPTSRSAESGASKDQSSGGQGEAFDRQPQQRNRQPGQPPEPSSSKARAGAWNQEASISFGKENQ